MKLKRVVVTGMGALTPIGNNVNDFWDNLVKGKSGVAEITKFALHLLKQDLPEHTKSRQMYDMIAEAL